MLSQKLREEIERELTYFMSVDPVAEAKPDHRYFVRSLYFDDPVFSNYYDKTDGLHSRSKFRVRTYTGASEDAQDPFLEIRRHENGVVFKHRVAIKHTLGPAQAKGDRLVQLILHATRKDPICQRLEYEWYRKRLRPVILIDYHRRPYLTKYDPEFRLTFDDHLAATTTQHLFPSPQETGHCLLPGYTIMEVKFRVRVPAWFHRLVCSYELQRVSISKVCRGIEALGLAPNLE